MKVYLEIKSPLKFLIKNGIIQDVSSFSFLSDLTYEKENEKKR